MTHRFLAGVGAASLTAAALGGAFHIGAADAHVASPGAPPVLTANTLKTDHHSRDRRVLIHTPRQTLPSSTN